VHDLVELIVVVVVLLMSRLENNTQGKTYRGIATRRGKQREEKRREEKRREEVCVWA
jgi:hypothetical protein